MIASRPVVPFPIASPGVRAFHYARTHVIRLTRWQAAVAALVVAIPLMFPLAAGRMPIGAAYLLAPQWVRSGMEAAEAIGAWPGRAWRWFAAPVSAAVAPPRAPERPPAAAAAPAATVSGTVAAAAPASTTPATEDDAAPGMPSPRAPSATRQPTGAAVDGPAWTIQVRAFPVKADAEAMAAQLEAKGYPVTVSRTTAAGQTVFRVRVGNFPARADADATIQRLYADERLDTWLVHLSQ